MKPFSLPEVGGRIILYEVAMPFCPECRTEYRLGFTHCADCHTALVSAPPPPHPSVPDQSPIDYAEFVAVLDTTDNFALAAASGLLDEAEIPYVIDDEPQNVPREVMARKHKWWIPACRIWVSPEREREARELLESFARPEAPETDPNGWER